jgi:hypothetical protein
MAYVLSVIWSERMSLRMINYKKKLADASISF